MYNYNKWINNSKRRVISHIDFSCLLGVFTMQGKFNSYKYFSGLQINVLITDC